jgi:hypothetical protein
MNIMSILDIHRFCMSDGHMRPSWNMNTVNLSEVEVFC